MDSDEPENPPGDSALLGGKPPLAAGKDASRKERDIRDDLNAFEKQSVKLQRRLFWATIAIWVTTGVYVFVTYRQWRTMQDQLGVMNNQLADARKSAIESGKVTDKQLDIARKQADSQRILADANKDIATAAKDSAAASNRQWRVMEQQATLMRDQLVDTRRAAKDSADAIERQLKIADTQASSMKTLADATKDVAEASKRSMASAERTVSILQQTLHVDQRAWLRATISESFKYWPLPFGFKVWPKNYVVKWLNTGKTPAHNITAVIIAEYAAESGPRFDYARAEGVYAVESLEPNAVRETALRSVRSIVARKPNQPIRLYIHGVATYDDIFEGHHWMEFCYIMRRDGDVTVCDNHNGDDSQTNARPPGLRLPAPLPPP